MNTELTSKLLGTLIILGLVLALWFAASILFIILKQALEALGIYTFPAKAAELAQRLSPGRPIAEFFVRANTSMERNGDSSAVRVALEERHQELQTRLGRTEQTVRDTVNSVQGLAGLGGGATFLTEFNALRERTKLVDRLAVELSPDIEDEYAKRAKLRGEIMVLVPMVLLAAGANGALLSLLFGEMTSIKIFGVLPMAYLLGVVVVVVEILLGIALHKLGHNKALGALLVVLIAVMTAFEAGAMSIFSVELSTSFRDVDVSEAALQDYWMVLLALVFTPMTSISGFLLHKAQSESDELKGRTQLRNEEKRCNEFVANLPATWGAIEQKARSAEAAIERFQDALGGQDDRLAGAIDALTQERKRLSTAILGVKPEGWPALAKGGSVDARHAATQNIFLFLLMLLALAAYSAAVAFVVYSASAGRWLWPVSIAIGLTTSLLFLIIGNLAFNRLRLIQGDDGRAEPMSAQPLHKATAGVLVVGCAFGLIWASYVAFGWLGIVSGLFLTALGGALSFLGYRAERAARGLVLVSMLIVALGAAILSTGFVTLRYAILWSLAATAWLLGFVVHVLAKPAELVLNELNRRRPAKTVAAAAE